MARGRMLSSSIAVSETLSSMSEWAQLVTIYTIPHLDDFGLIVASPTAKFKATVLPRSPRSAEETAAALAEAIRCDFFFAYEKDEVVYLCARNFENYQSGLHKRTHSRYPSPKEGRELTPEEFIQSPLLSGVPGNSGKLPELPSQEKRREQKRTTPPTPSKEGGTKRSSEKTEIPEDFTPTPEMIAWAEKEHPQVDWRLETKRFVLSARSRGARYKRHDLAWKSWISGRFVQRGKFDPPQIVLGRWS